MMLSLINLYRKNSVIGAAVLAAGLLVPALASAAPAVLSSSVNVRTGPGAAYARVATLPAGTTVDAGPCRAGWCRMRKGGSTGWVSARYLRFGSYAGYANPAYAGPAYADNGGFAPGFGLGLATGLVANGGWGPGWREGWRGGWHGRPDYYRGYHGGYRGPYGRPGWNRGGHGWNPRWGVGPARFGGHSGYHIGSGVRPTYAGR